MRRAIGECDLALGTTAAAFSDTVLLMVPAVCWANNEGESVARVIALNTAPDVDLHIYGASRGVSSMGLEDSAAER
jgi:hypothetical protein